MLPNKEQFAGRIKFDCDTIIIDNLPEFPQPEKNCLMRQVASLSGKYGEMQDHLIEATELIRKSALVIEDMRVTDRYNANVDFDVNEHLKDLEGFLKAKQGG
jgi:hypothetical protein